MKKIAIVLFVVAAALAGCGKKKAPAAPAGGVLVGLGRKDEAAEIYRTGVEVAQRRGDQHARGEIEAALAEIEPV